MSVDFAEHLRRPFGRGHMPSHACTGAAGGAACGDLIRISLALDADSPKGVVGDAGFDASGCGATLAAGSAAVSLVRGAGLLEAASIGAQHISAELGGLHPAKQHAAELASDALHRALGQLARRAQLAPAGRTLVAMSGGVDSAVAALLVRDARRAERAPRAPSGGVGAGGGMQVAERDEDAGADDVVAVTLELWSDSENDGSRSCCSAQAVRGAREIAHSMGMAHFSIDLREEFRAGVVSPWLEEHRAGLTPNPCVRCNGKVRLDGMLELGERLGARTLATGHYARLHDGLLRVAQDESKDQSYALAALSPSSIARMHFPLGELTKVQVRERASDAGLEVAKRPDSQDLCFLAGTDRSSFLARHGGIGRTPGTIVDEQGNVLGRHEGLHTVTVGQRRGLGLSGGEARYVIDVRPDENTIAVGPRERLLCERVSVRDVVLHRDGACVDAVKVRYRGRRMSCVLEGSLTAGAHEHALVRLLSAAERTAPGQVACLYSGEQVVGHGIIVSSSRAQHARPQRGASTALA
jgi:tRNA-uridine 2-sulfurtransferase